MPAISGLVDFNPLKDLPSLEGKVILITGGTAGIGATTISHLLPHSPSHIYFTGRNARAASDLITTLTTKHPSAKTLLTFIPLDLSDLTTIKPALQTHFHHSRLDTLILNAGIMAQPPALSPQGYELQFATNHLGHACILSHFLPLLLSTAKLPSADVRVVTLTSLGYAFHPKSGVDFGALDSRSTFSGPLCDAGGGWLRYGQSKLANILYASALARRHPEILSVSVHPGVVKTPLVDTQGVANRVLIYVSQWVRGNRVLSVEEGSWNSVWAACCAAREGEGAVRNGGFFLPVGVDGWEGLDKSAKDEDLADRLWEWTEGVLEKVRNGKEVRV